MSYVTDKLWVESKRVARSNGLTNNWLEIMEYYHSKGGYQATIHAIISERQRQILHILDNNQVLLIDSNQVPYVEDYQTVMESKKLFFYVTGEPQTTIKVSLPDELTYKNKKIVKVKVV